MTGRAVATPCEEMVFFFFFFLALFFFRVFFFQKRECEEKRKTKNFEERNQFTKLTCGAVVAGASGRAAEAEAGVDLLAGPVETLASGALREEAAAGAWAAAAGATAAASSTRDAPAGLGLFRGRSPVLGLAAA